MKKILATLALALVSQMTLAAQIQVNTLVMPAWLERGTLKKPLLAGAELENGDIVRTGVGSRVYLQMADGSVVKLGEAATMHVGAVTQQGGVNRTSLDFLQGAFRVSSNQSPKAAGKREVTIRINSISASLRDADVWGKSAADADLIALVEGQAALVYQDQALELTETMTYFRAERNLPAKPVRGMSVDQFNKWAIETDILPGQGVSASAGPIWLLLGEFATQQEALSLYDELRQEGYAARLSPIGKGRSARFRVRINDLPDIDEAKALAQRIRQSVATPIAEIRSR